MSERKGKWKGKEKDDFFGKEKKAALLQQKKTFKKMVDRSLT